MNNETKNETESKGAESGAKAPNVLMAVIAYILFFIPLLTDAKDDPFVKFHVKQGLALFILSVAGNMVLGMIPLFGWLALFPFNFAVFILWILGIMHALGANQKPLPLIGKLAESFKF